MRVTCECMPETSQTLEALGENFTELQHPSWRRVGEPTLAQEPGLEATATIENTALQVLQHKPEKQSCLFVHHIRFSKENCLFQKNTEDFLIGSIFAKANGRMTANNKSNPSCDSVALPQTHALAVRACWSKSLKVCSEASKCFR